MRDALLKVLAIPTDETRTARDWFRAIGPLLAPLAIVACGWRIELLLVALVWILLLIPGLLATNLLFSKSHPFGRGASRLGVASVLTLLPFGVFSWLGCILHWTLSTVIVAYAFVYVVCVCVLAYLLIRRSGDGGTSWDWPTFTFAPSPPRWVAVAILVLIAVMMVGVYMAAPPSHTLPDAERFDPAKRPDWWYGLAVGMSASLLCAGLILVFGSRKANPANQPDHPSPPTGGHPPSPKKGKRHKHKQQTQSTARQTPRDVTAWLAAPLWLAVGAMTLYLMLFTFSKVPTPMPEGRTAIPWNVDDVAYVSEAVDYRFGHAMGKYEPSLGSDHGMSRSGMSPLVAPLVAMIARATGVQCAALHHSVMPPLVVLISTSCMAAALMVVFRMHRFLVPVGLLITLLLFYKSWDYARCVVEMLAFRPMQPKALHLSLIHPLQLATLALLIVRPNRLHLATAVAIALVGHGIHPLATIMGMVWTTALLVAGIACWRKSLIHLAIILVVYCGLGGLYRFANTRPMEKGPPPSNRVSGSMIQSRDLVRVDAFRFNMAADLSESLDEGRVSPAVAQAFRENKTRVRAGTSVTRDADDGSWIIGSARRGYRIRTGTDGLDVYEIAGKPALRHDPFWEFGSNTLFLAGTLAVAVLLAFGRRRPEVLCVGVLGAAVVAMCNFEPLGELLNSALPVSIFWRARWMLPSMVGLACVGAVIVWAVGALLRHGDGTISPGRQFAASLVAVAAFAGMVRSTTSVALEIGPPADNLTKFSDDMHALVEILGGTEASPFVWGPFLVNHELPQLMPNVKLVKSRDKWTRTADHPQYHAIVKRVFDGFRKGNIHEPTFRLFTQLYPIDHIVISYRYRNAKGTAAFLKKMGWERVERAGEYEVYRRETSPTDSPDAH